jgi:TonB family protein
MRAFLQFCFVVGFVICSVQVVNASESSLRDPALKILKQSRVVESGELVKPRLKSKSCTSPVYPAQSLLLKEEGRVTIRLYIGETGAVEAAHISKSSGFPLLDEAAIKFFKQCEFEPGTQKGSPVGAWESMKYTWKLPK